MAHPAIPDTAFALIRIVALVEPRYEKLTARDVAMLDTVLFDLWDKTAADVSEMSHGRAWRIAMKHGVPIPYQAAYLSDDDANEADRIRVMQLAEKHGWGL